VIAVEPTETVALGRFDVVRVVTHNPQVGLSLLKSLSARLRATDDQVVLSAPNLPDPS
jgi:CRP-like cAMP-binding protein